MAKTENQSIGNAIEESARRAAVDAEAKRKAAEAAIELRDEWVPKLFDHGYGYTQIARIMMMSTSRVGQILARTG